MTSEGKSAVQECKHVLELYAKNNQSKTNKFELSSDLCRAAKYHAEDIGPKNLIQNESSDGSRLE